MPRESRFFWGKMLVRMTPTFKVRGMYEIKSPHVFLGDDVYNTSID